MRHARNKKTKFDARTKMFLQTIRLIPYSWAEKKALAHKAGVSPYTLYNWTDGVTTAPRIDTLVKVLKALGYSVEIKVTQHRMLTIVR